ncbi:MAG: hypothetical protein N3G79_07105, partial [Sulfolobales archaeon]|nr:hypothetical protein [Sulfolobales archaeon]
MELRREVVREVRLVGLGVTLALIVIGLIGLVEKGPVIPSVPVGSSPLSPLSYGTFSLYEIARSSYNTVVVVEPRDVFRIRSSRCVYIVISPSKPVERDRASEVLELLKKACSSTAVLIADEEPTSTG